MTPVLRTAPISDMKIQQSRVLSLLPDGPIVLMQRSTPAAVMVTPDAWNHTAAHIAKLEGIIQAMEIASREDETISLGDLCKELDFDPKQTITSETTIS